MRQLTVKFGLFLLLCPTLVPAVEFKRQTITVSSDPGWQLVSHMQDIDNDGLTDLLVLAPMQRELLVYRQRKSGFTGTSDQTVTVDRGAAWVGLNDVDPHPGNELLVSTAKGVVYFRQNRGVFESSPRKLIQAQQVFTTEYPRLMANLSEWGDANSVVPITSVDHTVLYQRESSGT
ncbi:MAG: VCBS repeat-containing protein, partial [Phycisphaerales bacterium]